MYNFESRLDEERDGKCKALNYEFNSKTFERCDQQTKRTNHPYCRNHWTSLDAVGKAKFPPKIGKAETRAAQGITECFFLKKQQMTAYRKGRTESTEQTYSTGIHVKTRPIPAKWKPEDAKQSKDGKPFWVYSIRAADGSIYVGQTRKDVDKRFNEHKKGTGSQHLRDHGISGNEVLWSVPVSSRTLALELERTMLDHLKLLGFRATIGEDND